MDREQALGNWLVKHEDTISEAGLNLNDLFDALKMIDSVNPRYVELMKRIQQSLDI